MIRPTRCLLPLLGASLCTRRCCDRRGADAATAAPRPRLQASRHPARHACFRQSRAYAGPPFPDGKVHFLPSRRATAAERVGRARGDLPGRPVTNDASAASASTSGPTTARTCCTCRPGGARTGAWHARPRGRQRRARPHGRWPAWQEQVIGLSARTAGVVLVGLNDRKPDWHDAYEIDIASGEPPPRRAQRTRRLRANLAGLDLKPASRCAPCPTAARVLPPQGDGWNESWPTAGHSLTTQPSNEGDASPP